MYAFAMADRSVRSLQDIQKNHVKTYRFVLDTLQKTRCAQLFGKPCYGWVSREQRRDERRVQTVNAFLSAAHGNRTLNAANAI